MYCKRKRNYKIFQFSVTRQPKLSCLYIWSLLWVDRSPRTLVFLLSIKVFCIMSTLWLHLTCILPYQSSGTENKVEVAWIKMFKILVDLTSNLKCQILNPLMPNSDL